MDSGPRAYETTYETRNEVISVPIRFNKHFLCDAHGILKIIEICLTIIVFICVGSGLYISHSSAGGWINFTAAMSLILSVFFFIIYLFNLIHRMPGPWVLIDFFIQAILCFLLTISMIVAAASTYYGGSPAIAAAVFCAFLAVAYLIECILRFSVRRQDGSMIVTSKGVTRAGPNFQVAPDQPQPTGDSAYPTDSYGMP